MLLEQNIVPNLTPMNGWVGDLMEGWINEWLGGQRIGWVGWMDGWIGGC